MSSPFTANPDINPDDILVEIARYVATGPVAGAEAYETARYCLFDALGCGLLALQYPECVKLLGPVVPGANLPSGARVPGTNFRLDPVQAAFNIGTIVRWLDFNDTWLAAEWGHPSDNLGAILAVADYISRTPPPPVSGGPGAKRLSPVRGGQRNEPGWVLTMQDVLTAMIKAYEVQGVLALANSFNRVGLDHVLLVRVASTAVATAMLGGNEDQVRNAVSHAWIDGGALRTYRHAPNTGSRKSWAAGDATSRAVLLALMTMRGEMGYPTPLSAKTWGFYDVLFDGKPFVQARPYGSYVMENILFKIAFPAEFHAQTAVETAFQLHPAVKDRLAGIDRIEIATHESAIRIIDKKGPLHNPADRDHCLQYMTAIGLIFGDLTAQHYEDKVAADPRIDALRGKMVVTEDKQYSADYLDPEKRSIANAVRVFFSDGSSTGRVAVEYPLGHRRRRSEAIPLLLAKFETNALTRLSEDRVAALSALAVDDAALSSMPVPSFMDMLTVE